MPLYMDTHDHIERPASGAAPAFEANINQQKGGARYVRCWFDGTVGKVFCIIEAPSKEAAMAVHRAAHGLIADRIVEVCGSDRCLGLAKFPSPDEDLTRRGRPNEVSAGRS